MRLYVEPMDAFVVDVGPDGRVRYGVSGDETSSEKNAEWVTPSLQERRAILYAARQEAEALAELLEILDPESRRP